VPAFFAVLDALYELQNVRIFEYGNGGFE